MKAVCLCETNEWISAVTSLPKPSFCSRFVNQRSTMRVPSLLPPMGGRCRSLQLLPQTRPDGSGSASTRLHHPLVVPVFGEGLPKKPPQKKNLKHIQSTNQTACPHPPAEKAALHHWAFSAWIAGRSQQPRQCRPRRGGAPGASPVARRNLCAAARPPPGANETPPRPRRCPAPSPSRRRAVPAPPAAPGGRAPRCARLRGAARLGSARRGSVPPPRRWLALCLLSVLAMDVPLLNKARAG